MSSPSRPSSASTASSQQAIHQHLARIRAARELYLQRGGTSNVEVSGRRLVRQQLEQHMRMEQARRRAELSQTYGRRMAGAPSGKPRKGRTGSPPRRQQQQKLPAMPALTVGEELLGEGVTSQVFAATFGPRAVDVAAKVVRKDRLTPEQLGWIREEIAIHRRLRHPHVCTLHGAVEDSESITMVLSLCRGGSLCDTLGRALDTNRPLTEEKTHSAFVQLCGALHYCHRNGVVHRDIKLDNLCWTDGTERILQLIDFGYASTRNEQNNFAGSPHYAAPEVHRANEEDSPQFLAAGADIWSAGVCLFAMLATKLPFAGGEETEEEREELSRKVCAGKWDPWEPTCSPAALDLVTRILAVDAQERCTLDEICEHEWIDGLDAVPWEATPSMPQLG